MAINGDSEDTISGGDDSAHESMAERFLATIESKFEGKDQADLDREDGLEVEQDGSTGSDDGDAGDPKTGTSSARTDGSDDESETDPAEDELDGDPDDSDPAGEDDDDDESTGTEEDDDDLSPETKAALEKHGAKLKLDDLPEEYRGIVKDKFKNIDAAFTRAQMENTEFRAVRARVQAEERYRADHPEMFIVEMLEKGGDELLEKVQERLNKLVDDDQKQVFSVLTEKARSDAAKAVDAERNEHDRLMARGQEIVDYTRAQATAAGVPWNVAELAIEAAILRKPDGQADISNEEVDAIIKTQAGTFTKAQREATRQASKDVHKRRVQAGKQAPPTTAARRPAAAVTPRPVVRAPKVDHSSEEGRQAALMNSMRRIKPGAGR